MRTSAADQLVLWHRWLPRRGKAAEQDHVEIAAWSKKVATRFEVGGGELLSRVGGSVVAAYDPADCTHALELSLDLLDEAEASGIEITLGVAIGPLSDHVGIVIGAVIERAQQLANRARGGELVLDAQVRDRAREEFLFGRQVAGAWRGTTIDRKNPRRVESANEITRLARATFPGIGGSVVANMSMHLEAGSARTFVLRGPVGSGARELVSRLGAKLGHAAAHSFGASPGGVVPLASLRQALLYRFGSPEEVTRQILSQGGTPTAADMLGGVAAGELVPLSQLAESVAALLGPEPNGALPWLLLSPLSLIDAATLAVLLEARTSADFVIFARLPTEATLPRPFGNLDERVIEHVVPPLKTSDARVVAEELLGRNTDPDVARRVAVLGGDTMIGVVEAARTLIATGELVRGAENGFVWRAGPRSGADMISTEALISERIDLLDAGSRQVLEALCVAPDASTRVLLEAAAARDGIGPATFDASLERLTKEAFTQGEDRPRPTSSLLRWRVLELIPSGRSMELHRFVGEALAVSATEHAPRLAELGYYLLQGGLEEDGRPLLTSVIEDLVHAGYRRAARHLSGWMAEASADSTEGAVTRATPVPPPAEAHDEGPPSNELDLDEFLDEVVAAPAAEIVAVAPAAIVGVAPAAIVAVAPAAIVAVAPAAIVAVAEAPVAEAPVAEAPVAPGAVAETPPLAEALVAPALVAPIAPALDEALIAEASIAPPLAEAPVAEPPALDDDDAPVAEAPITPPVAEPPVAEAPIAPPVAEPPIAPVIPPPPPPAARSSSLGTAELEVLELSVDEMEFIEEPFVPSDDELVLDMDELSSLPENQPAGELVLAGLSSAPPSVEPPTGVLELEAESEAGSPSVLDADAVAEFEAEFDAEFEPDSDATMLSDAGELMRAMRAHGEPPAKPLPIPPPARMPARRVAPEPPKERSFGDKAAAAIRAGDFNGLERVIERRIAEGGDLGAIGRVRAVAQLAQGDVGQARRSLEEALARGRNEPADRARYDVAMALLSLRSGQALEGVRQGLSALASSREIGDARGEEAALKTLAACFRALGMDERAQRLDRT